MEKSDVIEAPPLSVANLSLGTVMHIPAVRQFALLIGVAAAVAAGFAIVLWSQEPGYARLYANLEASEAAEVADALRAADIDFRINETTGDILVPDASVQSARLSLASQGLPQSAAGGISAIAEQSSFGVSQFMENARYQHALEAELARTIASLGAVREARVHLALPKQSSFVRGQRTSSASVLLQLHRGRTLEQDQAAAVVNLVAASVPDLSPKNVTVVDQYGSILSNGDELAVGVQANSQFKYARRLEETYKARIEDLLTPLVGVGRVRAEVVADIDFTVTEEARETFDPDRTVVRSEYVNEDLRTDGDAREGGVPGALSNQPPAAAGEQPEPGAAAASKVTASARESTRNYEVDRTISHTRPQAGTIRKLSVAVLIDDGLGDEAPDEAAQAEADLARYTTLVREAVGFDESRGDTVVVLSETFRKVEQPVAEEPPAFWEKPVIRDSLKQVLGAALALAIVFGVIRPMLRNVVSSSAPSPISGEFIGHSNKLSLSSASQLATGAAQIPPPSYDEKVAAAKNITGHDPARVAQLVKKWVAADA